MPVWMCGAQVTQPKSVKLMSALPAWASHIFLHHFLDADIAIQAGVDRNRAAGKGNRVFVPAASDKGVVALHQWMRRFAKGVAPVPAVGPADDLPREKLLDRCALEVSTEYAGARPSMCMYHVSARAHSTA